MFKVEHRHAVWGGIWIDASLEEVHTGDVEITTHPVEEGSDITDNVRPKADVVRITGVISNEPIETPKSHADGASPVTVSAEFDKGAPSIVQGIAGGGLLGQAAGAITGLLGLNKGTVSAMGFDQDFNRVADVYDELLAMKNEGRLFEIETTLRLYESMVLRSLEVIRTAADGQWLKFTAEAEQLLVVTSETADLPEPQVERGKGKTKKAKQPKGDAGGAGELATSTLAAVTGV